MGPLLDLPPPAQTLMMVVDALDVGYGSRDGCDKSSSVAKLLAANQHLLPSWLLLVCSVRRQNKAVCKMFSGTNAGQLFLMQIIITNKDELAEHNNKSVNRQKKINGIISENLSCRFSEALSG